MLLSVIIPAYNEAKRIKKTLLTTSRYLKQQSYDYEILVVNDGSTDKTSLVVKQLSKTVPCLRLIDNRDNHGKGWVVRQGMRETRGDYRLFMDADNSTSIDQVAAMLPWFQKGYDVVIGSRRIKGAKITVQQPWLRDVLGAVFRLLIHILVPLAVTDSQAGFKLFSQKSATLIFERQTIFRWAFDVELLAIAHAQGCTVKEVPIIWSNDASSHVKISGMINMLFEVTKIRLNLWDNLYSRSNK